MLSLAAGEDAVFGVEIFAALDVSVAPVEVFAFVPGQIAQEVG